MITLRIRKMEKNEFDKKPGNHPDTLYSWRISRTDSNWTTSSSITFSDVQLLMDHFGVNDPSKLIDKTFETPDDYSDPSLALDLLLKKIQHGGSYNPPSSDQLISRAINALAAMNCPDFSDVDSQTVYEAFQGTFQMFSPKTDWLKWFKEQISVRSLGEVQMDDANVDDFKVRVRGPADYLMLVRGNQKIRVIFGPYSTPFSFDMQY